MQKLTEHLDRPIVLVGLMGAGKSTVGRRLAQAAGPAVRRQRRRNRGGVRSHARPNLFERYGEHDFRDGERRLVARLVDGEVRVIATGGGAFIDPRTRELLTSARSPSGSMPRSTCWPSAPAAATTRPLLKKGNRSETLARLAEERRHCYAEAQIHIRSGGGAHGDVVEAIIAALNERLAQ